MKSSKLLLVLCIELRTIPLSSIVFLVACLVGAWVSQQSTNIWTTPFPFPDHHLHHAVIFQYPPFGNSLLDYSCQFVVHWNRLSSYDDDDDDDVVDTTNTAMFHENDDETL